MLGYSIRRAEEPAHLTEPLRHHTLAYIPEADLDGKRLLDFGCGSGSSTVALARPFPRTHIVAVDLEEGNISVARLRAAHDGVGKATFLVSPGLLDLSGDITSPIERGWLLAVEHPAGRTFPEHFLGVVELPRNEEVKH